MHSAENGCAPLSEGRTLILTMTPKQKRMLAVFGAITSIDATYKTSCWGLPFFILVVVDAQGKTYPAAFFWIASETTEAIAEVMVLIQHMVPAWKPEVMLMDKSDAEIGAIQQVLPQVFIILCDFHFKQAIQRWVTCKSNAVGTEKDQEHVYKLIAAIADSTTIEKRDIALQAWNNHLNNPESHNAKMESWWKNEHEPSMNMWCKALRQHVFNRGINTTNHNESCNAAVKTYLRDRLDFKIASMVQQLNTEIIAHYDDEHASTQAAELGAHWKAPEFDSFLEADLKHFSKKVMVQLQARLESSRKMGEASMQVLESGYVFKFTAPHRKMDITTNLRKGTCECLDFCQRRLPCKHMFRALLSSGKGIRALPTSILCAPHLAIDRECLLEHSYVKPMHFKEEAPCMRSNTTNNLKRHTSHEWRDGRCDGGSKNKHT